MAGIPAGGLSIDRPGDVLNAPAEAGSGSKVTLPKFKGGIRFEGVPFSYGLEGPWTLDDINFELDAGATLGIELVARTSYLSCPQCGGTA